jgi:MoaA/NifB/PqqE/SkfB family radical SAM enzyme/SAM-dependent methyltransferase
VRRALLNCMSKTACIVPWTNLAIGPDGRATFCCDVPEPLTVDGRRGSVYRDSLDDLWNAREVVQVRAAMSRGEKPTTCRVCWEREAAGGVSRRLLTNTLYRRLGGRLAIDGLSLEGAESGYRLERRPDWFILEMGNVCDLKCRSCNSLSSSRIAADAVQQAWNASEPSDKLRLVAIGDDDKPGQAAAPRDDKLKRIGQHRRLVPANTTAWFEDVDAVADMIASGADGNAMLSLMGGEPFLIDSTWRLLSVLVERGVAARLVVGLATNGQHRSARLAELAPHFRGLNLALSIDAHGKLYEYLRHGASWRKLFDNLRWFRQVPNLGLAAVPTLQNGNVLDMVTLLRFLDEQELQLGYNVLSQPARLRPTNLPPSVRRIAAERLRRYLEAECNPANVSVVRGYCEVLEEAGDSFDAGLFNEFMAFTNDLDSDRGENLHEGAPELVALVRAAGIEWSEERRHTAPVAAAPAHRQAEMLQRVNRTVSLRDETFAGFEAWQPGNYFSSGANQLAEIDARLRACGQPGLAGARAVADFACHYGRMTRALRAALPHAAIYACDIDRAAVQFCANELGALPVVTGWRPDEDSLPGDLDAVVCVSLLTHTPLDHWRRVLRAWAGMLRADGVAAFTFLSESHVEAWLAGAMEHYGSYADKQRAAAVRSLHEHGFGFAALTSDYGGEPLYGIAFGTREVVRREIAGAGLELLALAGEVNPLFVQDLVLVRKPEKQCARRAARGNSRKAATSQSAQSDLWTGSSLSSEAPVIIRDVSLVALYDPRCYAPAEGGEDSHARSIWARLAAADPPRPLPTELGFSDPRVPEVREAQTQMAREHGVDAFCYVYTWGRAGPSWDAPWRDLVSTSQPDFPFCLMVAIEGEPISVEAAVRIFDDISAGLQDRRYLRVEDCPLLVVRDVPRLAEPRAIAEQWRAAAEERGLGELHLCAAEPASADCPQDLGFDSFLQVPEPASDYDGLVSAALSRPRPRHRLFPSVECRRDAADPRSIELYEHWLRSAFDGARRHGERLVFVNAWNDWPSGRYLEPDDRDGRAALLATRRATRGPASGLVLLRQLRDELGEVQGPARLSANAAAVLSELEQVLGLHEHTRDRLLASVEAALGRNLPVDHQGGVEASRWVPVASRHLPSSGGGFSLDAIGNTIGAGLHRSAEPIPVRGEPVRMAGWAHLGNAVRPTTRTRLKAAMNRLSALSEARAPGPADEVDLFVALESSTGSDDRIFRIGDRVARPDVAKAMPGYAANCGFDTIIDLCDLRPGTYQVAIVQRTPHGAYRDATGVWVKFDGGACSSA